MKKLLYISFFVLSISTAFCQVSVIDSLENELKTEKQDTNKVQLLNLLSKELRNNDFDKAYQYAQEALELSIKLKYLIGIGSSYNNLGILNRINGNYPKALKIHFTALKIYDKLVESGYKDAKNGISSSYLNIGIIYFHQGNYEKSIENYQKALKIDTELGNKYGMAGAYNNIGMILSNQLKYEEALKNYFSSVKIYEELSDKKRLAYMYNNIGTVYTELEKFNESVVYHSLSLKTREELNDLYGISSSLINLGDVYFLQKKYTDAQHFLQKGLIIARQINSKENIKESYIGLSSISAALKDYKQAYEYQQLYSQVKDSLLNEENNEQIAEMATKYETEKKDSEIKLLNKDKEVQSQKQKYTLLGLSLVVVLAAVSLLAFYNKRNANLLLAKQKTALLKQKELIEEKHKEITDSINYAERIQRSFLATTEMLDQHLKDYFVFFRPKDVVSGDFYWAGELNNGNFAFSVADSTGHGVPGAIMSILNISSLEKSIEKETAPDQILNKTRKIIIERLKKDGSTEGGKDGMDCSLLVLNQDRTQLSFAAANNPVFILRLIRHSVLDTESDNEIAGQARNDGYELIEFKPDKMPVGKHDNDTESFTLHTALLQKGDVIYALTDGFPDQFGGDKGKKYMIKNLKELLLQIAHLPMLDQEQKLAEEFDKWKGSNEQVDDVCIIGVRV